MQWRETGNEEYCYSVAPGRLLVLDRRRGRDSPRVQVGDGMSNAWHCDREDCITWTSAGFGHGFIYVEEDGGVMHFCSWDCLIIYGAGRHPLTAVC